jgi:hemolysin III
MSGSRDQYTMGEEIANAVTHGLGWAGSVVALIVLVALAARYGTLLHIVSSAVYGVTMMLLYTSSTMYHALSDPRAKRVFKIFDHSSIYLLIAGTYTPFTLITLHGPWGFSLFGLVWAIAVAGISAEAFWVYRPKWLSTVIYLAMGWLVVLAGRPLIWSLPPGGLTLLAAGGLAYTLGTVFYVLRVRYMHAVWHVFVLAGSALHFFAVLFYVLPSKV